MTQIVPLDLTQNKGGGSTAIVVIFLIFLLGGVGFGIWWFFIKCKAKNSECTTSTDCCKGLQCIDKKCLDGAPESDISTQTMCSDLWTTSSLEGVVPECPEGQIFNEESRTWTSPVYTLNECCRDKTCMEWEEETGEQCWNGSSVLSGNLPGYSKEECCNQYCGDWGAIAGNNCNNSFLNHYDMNPGYSEADCCDSTTCSQTHLSNPTLCTQAPGIEGWPTRSPNIYGNNKDLCCYDSVRVSTTCSEVPSYQIPETDASCLQAAKYIATTLSPGWTIPDDGTWLGGPQTAGVCAAEEARCYFEKDNIGSLYFNADCPDHTVDSSIDNICIPYN